MGKLSWTLRSPSAVQPGFPVLTCMMSGFLTTATHTHFMLPYLEQQGHDCMCTNKDAKPFTVLKSANKTLPPWKTHL